MEHDDELTQFHSNYPPISWETEDVEKIEEDRKYFIFGTCLGKGNSGTFRGCNVTRWWRTHQSVKAPFSDPYIWDYNGRWYVNDKDNNRIPCSAIFKSWYDSKTIGNLPLYNLNWFPFDHCANDTGNYGMNLVKTAIVPFDGSTLSVDCKVKIYDTRGYVFSKTFDTYCPNITYLCQGNECPPNTCAVDCGNHICCYDNRGIAVQTIAK